MESSAYVYMHTSIPMQHFVNLFRTQKAETTALASLAIQLILFNVQLGTRLIVNTPTPTAVSTM